MYTMLRCSDAGTRWYPGGACEPDLTKPTETGVIGIALLGI